MVAVVGRNEPENVGYGEPPVCTKLSQIFGDKISVAYNNEL